MTFKHLQETEKQFNADRILALYNMLKLQARFYEDEIAERKQSILENPTKKRLEHEFRIIHSLENKCDKIYESQCQLRFDWEDITEVEFPEKF